MASRVEPMASMHNPEDGGTDVELEENVEQQVETHNTRCLTPLTDSDDPAHATEETPIQTAMNELVSESWFCYTTVIALIESAPDSRRQWLDTLSAASSQLVSCGIMFLQAMALETVHTGIRIVGQVTDDDYFEANISPSGSDDPKVYRLIYQKKVNGLPLGTIVLLVFSFGILGVALVSEVRQITLTYTLLHEHWAQSSQSTSLKVVWLCVSEVQLLFRICIYVLFCEASMWLLGFSDGPFNLVLNALAIQFIVDCDDAVAKIARERWFGRNLSYERRATALVQVVAKRTAHRGPALEISVALYLAAYAIFVPFSFIIQKRLGSGRCLTNRGFMDNLFENVATWIKPIAFLLICCGSFQSLRLVAGWRRALVIVFAEFVILVVMFYTLVEHVRHCPALGVQTDGCLPQGCTRKVSFVHDDDRSETSDGCGILQVKEHFCLFNLKT